VLLQRKLNGGKERTQDTFFAGLFGGYLVFGERNAINEQVRLFSLTQRDHSPTSHRAAGRLRIFGVLVLF
jgi:hypothetical protein